MGAVFQFGFTDIFFPAFVDGMKDIKSARIGKVNDMFAAAGATLEQDKEFGGGLLVVVRRCLF